MTIIDFPSEPTNGQTINVGTTKYVFNSSYGTWDLVANVVEGTPGRFIVSSTEPEDVVEGDGWFDSNTGKMFILYDEYWVEVGPNLTGPAGEANFNTFMMMGA